MDWFNICKYYPNIHQKVGSPRADLLEKVLSCIQMEADLYLFFLLWRLGKVKFQSERLPADWVGKFFQYLYFSWYYSPLTVMWNITDKVSSLLHHFDQQDNDNNYNKAQSDNKNAHGFCVWIFTGKRQRWATKTLTW